MIGILHVRISAPETLYNKSKVCEIHGKVLKKLRHSLIILIIKEKVNYMNNFSLDKAKKVDPVNFLTLYKIERKMIQQKEFMMIGIKDK